MSLLPSQSSKTTYISVVVCDIGSRSWILIGPKSFHDYSPDPDAVTGHEVVLIRYGSYSGSSFTGTRTADASVEQIYQHV